jgi:excisionase family DNA binding protein
MFTASHHFRIADSLLAPLLNQYKAVIGTRLRRKVVMETKNEEAPMGAWLSYRSASAYANLGRTKLTELVSSGQIPAAKVGKAVRINRAGLDDYMRRNAYVESNQTH